MEPRILTHRPDTGWSAPLPRDLDSPRTLVAAFAPTGYAERPDVWASLTAAFPRSHVLACSTAGAIVGAQTSDDLAVVAVARFGHATLASAAIPIQAVEMSRRAGEKLGRQLAPHAPVAVLVVCDGVHACGTELVAGLASALPATTTIVGGLAADGERHQRTWTLVEGVPRSGWVSAVALSGPVVVGTGRGSGWQPLGPARRVTGADGPKLQTLDGQPALALYRAYLGDLAQRLPANAASYPLAVRCAGDGDAAVVRSVLDVDEATQSMTLGATVPEGARMQLLHAGCEALIEAAAAGARGAAAGAAGPVLALAIGCASRRRALGDLCGDETAAMLDALPGGSAQCGFHAYGAIAGEPPGAWALHNQTMTFATFREVAP